MVVTVLVWVVVFVIVALKVNEAKIVADATMAAMTITTAADEVTALRWKATLRRPLNKTLFVRTVLLLIAHLCPVAAENV